MKEKTKENIHKLGWVAAAAIVVCTFWWLWDQSQEEPVEYALCKVEPRDIEESITASGIARIGGFDEEGTDKRYEQKVDSDDKIIDPKGVFPLRKEEHRILYVTESKEYSCVE